MDDIADSKEDTVQTEESNGDTSCISQEEYDALANEYNILVEECKKLEARSYPSFWSEALNKPEGTKPLKDFITEISNELFTSWNKIQRGHLKYSLYHTVTTIAFLGGILWVAYKLTLSGNLDGSSTTFLLGTITGHFITYITKRESK